MPGSICRQTAVILTSSAQSNSTISPSTHFGPTSCYACNAARTLRMAGGSGMTEEFGKLGAFRTKAPPCRQDAALILRGEAQTAYVVDRS